MLILQSLTST